MRNQFSSNLVIFLLFIASFLSGCNEIDKSNNKSFSGEWVGFKSIGDKLYQYNLIIREDLSFHLNGSLNENGILNDSGKYFDLNGYCLIFNKDKTSLDLRAKSHCDDSRTGVTFVRPKSIDYVMYKYVFGSCAKISPKLCAL